jgi:hypothetical protein
MTLELVKPSLVKLELGLKLMAKTEDGVPPLLDTIALMMATDEEAYQSIKRPTLLEKYKSEAYSMDGDEAGDALAFFWEAVLNFSKKLQNATQASVLSTLPKIQD